MDTKRHARLVEPGHTVPGKRAYRSRRPGWEFVHIVVDDCWRLGYAELHDDESSLLA
jgi:hypothetical protein